MKILLLIADTVPWHQVFKETLLGMNCEYLTPDEDAQALSKILDEREFDLIIVDSENSASPAPDLIKNIRLQEKMKERQTVPIIVAGHEKDEEHDYIEAGANAYIKDSSDSGLVREILLYWVCQHEGEEDFIDSYSDNFSAMKTAEAPLVFSQGLNETKAIVGDQFHNIISQFFDSISEHMRDIKAAADEPDIEAIQFAAHDIKSLCRQIGAMKLSCVARDLEDLSKKADQIDPSVFHDFLSAMEKVFNSTRQAITDIIE